MVNKKNSISLSNDTAYLSGLIIGDGNLSNYTKSKTDLSRDYRIYIDLSDFEYVYYLEKLIKSLIITKSKPVQAKQRGIRKPRLILQIRNKELFQFLNEVMEIPKGNKCAIIRVPNIILNSSSSIKKSFVAGYFDADGGFRSGTIGFTSASNKLLEGISLLLNEFNIDHSMEKWINKKYGKEYYGIRIKKNQIVNFLNRFRLRNKNKLDIITNRFFCGGAGVAKRDR
jgi:intein/homing endonuclease